MKTSARAHAPFGQLRAHHLRVPYRLGASAEIPYATTPLGLISCDHTLAIVGARDNVVVSGLFEHVKTEVTVLKKHHVLLKALELTSEVFLDDLDKINDAVDRLEDRLRLSLANHEVMRLLRYQKALVYFTTALRAIDHMVDHLREMPGFRDSEQDRARFEDASAEIIAGARGRDRVARHSQRDDGCLRVDHLEQLEHRDEILAAFTIILTVPMTVASFYGMNVALPAAKGPHAFWILIAASLALAVGVFAAFRYKKWL
jgi:magnesium transporter